jgi:beta-lactam-binding protein with PASTA domain
VISQSVKAGKRVPVGTKVNLTAAKKKAPKNKKH